MCWLNPYKSTMSLSTLFSINDRKMSDFFFKIIHLENSGAGVKSDDLFMDVWEQNCYPINFHGNW